MLAQAFIFWKRSVDTIQLAEHKNSVEKAALRKRKSRMLLAERIEKQRFIDDVAALEELNAFWPLALDMQCWLEYECYLLQHDIILVCFCLWSLFWDSRSFQMLTRGLWIEPGKLNDSYRNPFWRQGMSVWPFCTRLGLLLKCIPWPMRWLASLPSFACLFCGQLCQLCLLRCCSEHHRWLKFTLGSMHVEPTSRLF